MQVALVRNQPHESLAERARKHKLRRYDECMGDGSFEHCAQLQSLMDEYTARAAGYSTAVSLWANVGTSTKEDYDAMLSESRRSCNLCKDARIATERVPERTRLPMKTTWKEM